MALGRGTSTIDAHSVSFVTLVAPVDKSSGESATRTSGARGELLLRNGSCAPR